MSADQNSSPYYCAALPWLAALGEFVLLRGQTWLDRFLFDYLPQYRCHGVVHSLGAGFFCLSTEYAILAAVLLAGPMSLAIGSLRFSRKLALGWFVFCVGHVGFAGAVIALSPDWQTLLGSWGRPYICLEFAALILLVHFGTDRFGKIWDRGLVVSSHLLFGFFWHLIVMGALATETGTPF